MDLHCTCDINLELVCARLAQSYKLHDPLDDLMIEAACLPTFQEALVNKGLCATQPVTPHRGVGHPPYLHSKEIMSAQPLILGGKQVGVTV